MRRLVTLMLAAAALALPPAALAQSAGDEQYSDPFSQTSQPNTGTGDQSGSSAQPAPAQTSTPTAAADQSVSSQESADPALPRTGFPVGYLAGTGALMLLAGTTLRRRVS
jgi:hypothetical protein